MADTPTETLEKEKKIAVFMGYTYYGHNDERLINGKTKHSPGWKKQPVSNPLLKIERYNLLCRTHNELRYRRDIEWLWPVCQKCRDVYLGITGHPKESVVKYGAILSALTKMDITETFEAVYAFIEHYNTIQSTNTDNQ